MKIFEITSPIEPDYEYRGEHQAPMLDDGCPLWDVTRNEIYPKDFYQGYAHRYYGDSTRATDMAISIVLRYYNRPNKFITVYRAIPKALPRGTKINRGDWVTIVRRYALEHGRSHLNTEFRVISSLVHARDLFTDGNSMTEWGYDPQPPVPKKPVVQPPAPIQPVVQNNPEDINMGL